MSMEPTIERPHPSELGGIQKLYRFDNGYGASVVRNHYSYGGSEGLWELAVLRFTGPTIEEFEISYDTPITDDVMGYLDEQRVEHLLGQIEALQEEK